MPSKDYYKILNLTHAASDEEIKKAYRQMAMRFHPDKNEGNQLAESHFREVLEAYEVLSDPRRRSAYNQQRWYRQSNRNHPESTPVTATNILYKCRMLNRYLSTLDPLHINRQALNHYIIHLLSENILQLLLAESSKSTNDQVIDELLKAIYHLPFRHIENISRLLIQLAGDDSLKAESIQKFARERKFAGYWNTYLPLLVLFISVLICLLIFVVARS